MRQRYKERLNRDVDQYVAIATLQKNQLEHTYGAVLIEQFGD